ncbi:MAG: amino acid adenylation domain-containing protein [Desulfobacteraceae bacterium]|jgi:amino acid adenylation domain-containing protein/FkbH-like protein
MISQILESLQERHISLWVDSGKLKYRAPKGALTSDLHQTLSLNKSDIIRYLSAEDDADRVKELLSYNQQSLWFMHQIAPASSCYHIAASCRVVSELNVEALSSAVNMLVDRHGILRSTYAYGVGTAGDQSFMIVNKNLKPVLYPIDASGWPEHELKSRLELYYSKPFDLENDSVFRLHLFKIKTDDYILMITIHHIACDAYSLGMLLNDLSLLYASESSGNKIQLPEINGKYKDFTYWQNDMLKKEVGQRHKTYWVSQLGGSLPALDLPSDFNRPHAPSYKGSSLYFNFSDELFKKIEVFCHQESVTKYTFFLALFQLFLMRYSRSEDILVGSPVIGRGRNEFKNICGNFINSVVMRARFSDSQTFRDHLFKTRRVVLTALDHQDYPFPVLVEDLMPARDPSRSPIFQAMFNLLDQKTLGSASQFLHGASFDTPVDFGGLKILPFPIDQEEGQFDLTLEMINTGEKFACAFKYNTDIFSEKTIAVFTESFCEYLVRAIDEPETLVSDFPVKIEKDIQSQEETGFDEKQCIAIAATYTADLLKDPLDFWVDKLAFKKSVQFAPYNQIFQQLLDPSSMFRKNIKGVNVILVRLEDWIKDIPGISHAVVDDGKVKQTLEQNKDEFLGAVQAFVAESSVPVLICFCPISPALAENPLLNRIENDLALSLNSIGNIYPVSSREILGPMGVEQYDEPLGLDAGHIPYTDEFFAALSYIIARKSFSILGKPYKAIVLDCDQTLWKGVVGEDGPLRVTVDPARKMLQELMVSQHEAGTLICLCSKNSEEDVLDVLDKNPEMILRRNHISYSKINWSPKSQNIAELAEEINIGLDSFIFIDDNPVECAEVRANCPEVLTLQLPSDPEKIKDFTKHIWAFDHLKLTKEDRERVDLYRKEKERSSLLKSSTTFDEFLKNLDLNVSISEIKDAQIQRVSQLTLRTNQFNLTTIRRNESEISRLKLSENHVCLVAEVSDKFGDYGLVGLVIYEKQKDQISVDTFLLSCRALGKGVEHALLNRLGRNAIDRGLKSVRLNYSPTNKNQPALNFLLSLGEEYKQQEGEGLFFLLPSQIASEASFSPSSATEKTSEDGEVRKTTDKDTGVSLANALVMQEIADTFSSLKSIMAAVDQRMKKQASVQLRSDQSVVFPVSQTEKNVASVWAEVLCFDDIGMNDNFFDIGGRSILMPGIVIRLSKMYGMKISIVDMFENPTIQMMSNYIIQAKHTGLSEPHDLTSKIPCMVRDTWAQPGNRSADVAIIGMAGRFPGADDISLFWRNIVNGIESITDFSDEELLKSGVPEYLIKNPKYVKRSPVLNNSDCFDAGFFGYTPREAEKIDPQQRIFLECAWDAFEDAGYVPDHYTGTVGVFAGCGMNNYLIKNLLERPELMESVLNFQTFIGNDKDFLSTRVSYKLGLKGPSLSVQTACSTSLVAVQLAYQSLLTYQCDMAIGGGVSLQAPRLRGYLHHEGEIFSDDGYCRPFDSKASGTLLGEGAGVVLLKRLEDAIEDHDHIYAVIKGAALNNDGNVKVGYTAPSVQGQTEVIAMAQNMSRVDPATIGYVEAHGTGTPLGDPIEVKALTQAFRSKTDKKSFCAIGSLKSNIGHLDVAAGVAGLIKTSLMVKHGVLPPTLNVTTVNPELNMEGSPFYVNKALRSWDDSMSPRRAGVSSFGVGGTNAHVILEEVPREELKNRQGQPWYLFTLSAQSAQALEQRRSRLCSYLSENPAQNAGDVAYTLQIGRKAFRHRSACVCKNVADAVNAFSSTDPGKFISGSCLADNRKAAFMFTGQGAQYVNMARDLFETEPIFKQHMMACSEILAPVIGCDLTALIYPEDNDGTYSQNRLNETEIAQPALFALEYSLARLFMEWGIYPHAMIGHSLGEYVAACLSGVFTLEDALKLVAERGRLMQQQPHGDMLAVALSEKDILPFVDNPVSLAVINSPGRCVVSGPSDDIARLHETLNSKKVQCTVLHTSHAFHSQMMEGAIDPLREYLKTVPLNNPQIPFISNVTGTWITERDATNPEYWARHLRQTVRFSKGIQTLIEEPCVLLEVGPGQTLTTLSRQNIVDKEKSVMIYSSVKHPQSQGHDGAFLYKTLSQLWITGVHIDWSAFNKGKGCGRVPLPGYPFQRQRFWIEPTAQKGYQISSSVTNEGHERPEVVHIEASSLYSRPSSVSSDYDRPSCEMEHMLVRIWQDVLGIDQIGVQDSFFELGGDSLIAAQIISRIREQSGSDLSIRKIFELPTIQGLADYLSREQSSGAERKKIETIVPESENEGLQLSLAQQRLWFINQLESHSPAYNIVQAVKLSGDLNEEILQKAFDHILARHDVLRTVFIKRDGRPAIERVSLQSIKIEKIVCTDKDGEQGEEYARRLIARKAPVLFDLENGPLLRVCILQTGKTEHIFAIILHHIIADGWSMGVWMKELSVLYHAFKEGRPSPLEKLPIQYADYAIWQKKWLINNDLNEQKKYWKERLKGELPVIQLPADYPRPMSPRYTGRHQAICLSAELTRSIQNMAKQEHTTVYTVLLSAYFSLLCKYSNQNGVVVGTPYANRDRVEIEGLIGFFINMLPIRLELSETTGFKDLVKQVHQLILDALSNKDLPFEKLVEILQPDRSLNHHPIFQVMFAFQNFPLPSDDSAELNFFPVVMDRGATEFELSLYMWEERDELRGVFEYSDEIFKDETIQRMVDHFQTLLQSMVENPTLPIQKIGLLTEPEKRLMLIDWNENHLDYPGDVCIHDMFDMQAEKTPDAVAIVHNHDRMSFNELKQRSNQLAIELIQMGVEPDVLVGICVERSMDMIVGMLAVLKAGGAYVPLDPGYPVERLKFMMSDSCSRVIITQKKFETLFSDSTARLITLEALGEKHSKACMESPSSGATQKNLAYIIYTSGSTGVPKGVAIEHRSAIALIAWARTVFTGDEIGGMLASTSICFDLSVFEIFLPLCSGGKIVLADNAMGLKNLPDVSEVRLINTVPSAIVELLQLKAIPANVTTINLAGEPLKQEIVDRLYNIKTVQRVFDLYGPSEDTTYSTCALRQKNEMATIGKPISNTRIFLVDPFQNPVPIGVPGELYIGGHGLARGYLNRAELTSEKFVSDFMSDDPASRLYRTGDLAKYFPDGTICYLGRMDHQVKLRGFRIELGEIEAALAEHKGIKQCVTLVREDVPDDKRLVAYIISRTGVQEKDSDLRLYLKDRLPEYMIPQHFVNLDSMPMTSNGKIDRNRLPKPVSTLITEVQQNTQITELETRILKIWLDIIGLEYIGVNDNFFEVGGHSILSVRIFSEIYNLTGINLPLAEIFKSPTVRELSKTIEASGGRIKDKKNGNKFLNRFLFASSENEKDEKSGWSHLVAIKPNGSKTPIFCMHAIGGNVLNYYPLASGLDADQPVYGLQARGLDGLSEPYSSIEEMAGHYIAEMKMIQPSGPYYLAGGSMGGFIAYEVAQQLKHEGQDIALLAMFDTFAPIYFKNNPSFSNDTIVTKMVNKFNALIFSKRHGTTFKEQFKKILESIQRKIVIQLKFCLCNFYHSIQRPIPHKLRYWYVEQKHWKPVLAYTPRRYDGDMVLFAEPQAHHGLKIDMDKGWNNYIVGNIDVIDIPAKHMEFMEEPLLVEKFYEYMQKYYK